MRDWKYFSYKYFLPGRSDCLIDSTRICWALILGNQPGKHTTDLLRLNLCWELCVSPHYCWHNMPLHACSSHWGGVMAIALPVSSACILIHWSGIRDLSMSVRAVTAMPFFPQPCEQGRRVKRIHAVANIGTALKFLEGRKVRNVTTTRKEESGHAGIHAIFCATTTACCLWNTDMQRWSKIILIYRKDTKRRLHSYTSPNSLHVKNICNDGTVAKRGKIKASLTY